MEINHYHERKGNMSEEEISRVKSSRRRVALKFAIALTTTFILLSSMIVEPVHPPSTLTYSTVIHTTQKEVYTRFTTYIDTSGFRYTAHIATTITSTYCWTETIWYETSISSEYTEKSTEILLTYTSATEPPPNGLVVQVTTDKSDYAVDDILVGEIRVTDIYGNPVQGSLTRITYVHNGRIFKDDSALTDINGKIFMSWQWREEDLGDWEVLVSASKEGYITASSSVKVSVQSQNPLTITIQTDREMYEQGEAVTVSGEVRYNNEPIPPKDREVVIEVLKVPNRQYVGRQTFTWYTDVEGRYSVMPFAGWEIGEYTIRAKCAYDKGKEKIVAESKPLSFYVEKATLVKDMRSQVKKITERYKDPERGIPEGPLRIMVEKGRFVKGDMFFEPPKIVKWGSIPESCYGAYTNLLHLATRDPKIKAILGPYLCGGYQAQTLKFMDHMRFHEDPEVRELLKGLDYGPIARGGGTYTVIGSHHAVVLYPIGTNWKWPPEYGGQFAKVFDPWPTQKPEVYYVSEFESPWGFVRVNEYYQSMYDPNSLFNGYPFTGGAIYVNYDVIGKRPTPPMEDASNAVVIDCPVDALITDSEGRRAGILHDGTFVQEFPAYIYQGIENNKTTIWYFGLPQGAFTLEITGQSTGTFNLLIGGEAVEDRILSYGEQAIPEGGTAKVTIGAGNKSPQLWLPDGKKVNPESFKESRSTLNLKLGALMLTAALILGVIFLVKRSYTRRRSNASATGAHQVALQSREEISGGSAFCQECGERIPADSMFCPYCGYKQGAN